MKASIDAIQKTFFGQAQTCLKSSLLYHDMLNIFGNKKEVLYFIHDIIDRRSLTGKIEAILTFIAFFHYNTLKNNVGFLELKKLYRTQGGNYKHEDFGNLENILDELWESNYTPLGPTHHQPISRVEKNRKESKQNLLETWMMETKLQTNEIARCNAIYPAILSLGLERINLIELGCSSGLILLMDLYSYEYFNDKNVFNKIKNQPLLRCRTENIDKVRSLFENEIEIVKKIGLDLFPVDLNNNDNVIRLKAALWDDSERSERLEKAIELFNKTPPAPLKRGERERGLEEMANPLLLALDYTQNLISPLEQLIDKNSDLVFYSSVSTYQIPSEAYHLLLERLAELAEYLGKNIYFIEFEELRKDQIKNVTSEDPFHLTIHTFPEGTSYEFGRAHFHGNSLTIY